MQLKFDFNEGSTPAVYQLDPEVMNVIYVPVSRILPVKKREAHMKTISDGLKESGYKHLLIPVMDD